jgi:toxin ParE1/3/4
MRFRYTAEAVRDLVSIGDYIRSRNPHAGAAVEAAIRTTIDLLTEFPQIGRDRPELGVRAIGIPRYPYTVYYRLDGGAVWVVHIRDDRRRPPTRTDL